MTIPEAPAALPPQGGEAGGLAEPVPRLPLGGGAAAPRPNARTPSNGRRSGLPWQAAPGRSPRPKSWSLVHRLTGGVALIALVSFLAQAVVLALWLTPVADDVAAITIEQAVIVRAALAATPAAQRAALAQRLSSGQITVSATEPPPGGTASSRPPWPLAEREFGSAGGPAGHGAGLALPADVEARLESRPGDMFAVIFRLPVDHQVWWLTRTASAPGGAVSGTLAVWLVLLAGATVGALLVSVRMIARPIGRLAQQISQQVSHPAAAAGLHRHGPLRPLPLHGDASIELQALVQAFNDLVQHVGAAAQARQQLLAGVSHDLRTPLARLRLRAETQCEPALADALTADLLALERIVDQFLAYVQGDSGMALGVPEPLDQSVRDAVLRYTADGQPVSMRLEPTTLQAPDLAVQRLLANLIDNAIAYGRGPVEVALRHTPQGAELCVSDHGPGMSSDEFERARQPFVRLTRARSELGHCGLGLAIVAQIARQLNGTLHAVRDDAGRFGIALVLPHG